MGIGPVSCENCSVFKKGEGGPEAPGALRLRNKKATASVASSYSQNPPVRGYKMFKKSHLTSLLQGDSADKKLATRNVPPFVLKNEGKSGPKVTFNFLKMWKLAARGPIRAPHD